MRMLFLFMGLSLFLASSPVSADTFDLTCTFSKSTTVFMNEHNKVSFEANEEEPWEIAFKNLDTDSPTIHRGVTHTLLNMIRKEPTTLWMGEVQALGQINYWTIFLAHKVVILSQAHSSGQIPVGRISMGRCD